MDGRFNITSRKASHQRRPWQYAPHGRRTNSSRTRKSRSVVQRNTTSWREDAFSDDAANSVHSNTILIGEFGPSDERTCVGPVDVDTRARYVVFLRDDATRLPSRTERRKERSTYRNSSTVSSTDSSQLSPVLQYFRVANPPVVSSRAVLQQARAFSCGTCGTYQQRVNT